MIENAKTNDQKQYNEDFYSWCIRQGELLRKKHWDEVDWKNILIEWDDMAKHDLHTVNSWLDQITVHLLCIQQNDSLLVRRNSPISHWLDEIQNWREEIIGVLDLSPGKKGVLLKDFPDAYQWRKAITAASKKIAKREGMNRLEQVRLRNELGETTAFTLSECLGFDIQHHSRREHPVQFDDDWLYPAEIASKVERIFTSTGDIQGRDDLNE